MGTTWAYTCALLICIFPAKRERHFLHPKVVCDDQFMCLCRRTTFDAPEFLFSFSVKMHIGSVYVYARVVPVPRKIETIIVVLFGIHLNVITS